MPDTNRCIRLFICIMRLCLFTLFVSITHVRIHQIRPIINYLMAAQIQREPHWEADKLIIMAGHQHCWCSSARLQRCERLQGPISSCTEQCRCFTEKRISPNWSALTTVQTSLSIAVAQVDFPSRTLSTVRWQNHHEPDSLAKLIWPRAPDAVIVVHRYLPAPMTRCLALLPWLLWD